MIEAFAGSVLILQDINAQLLAGSEVDAAAHNQISNSLVKLGGRLGLRRRTKDANLLDLKSYLRSKEQDEDEDAEDA